MSEVQLNMTQVEQEALELPVNAVDGHACRSPFLVEESTFARAAEYFRSPLTPNELQSQYVEAFLKLAGQTCDSEKTDFLLTPSSSAAFDIVAKYLKRAGKHKVDLVEPCFDSIPLLFGHEGLSLTAYSDSLYSSPDQLSQFEGDAICVVSPNNPTGSHMDEASFRELARSCAKKNQILIFDPSFRFYLPEDLKYDQYAILNELGVHYIVVEDTGKTWPDEVKLSILSSSKNLGPELARIASDLWLTQSKFAMQLLTSLVEATSDDQLQSLHAFIQNNRATLLKELEGLPITDYGTQFMSVAWLGLANMSGTDFIALLKEADPNVGILAGEGFYWDHIDSPDNPGRNHVRVALARNNEVVARVAGAMRKALNESVK